VKLVQTVMVRDEVDIIGAQLSYHLDAGVDFVIATDHDSQDGTSEVLESYARDGHLLRISRSGKMYESDWRSHMARLAAVEYGADWIINTDADEFWMPRRASLKEVLVAVPRELGVVWALTRHFVPRPEVEEDFAERMTARVAAAAPINDPTSPYRPHAKVAHRADPEIVIRYGAHHVHSHLAPLVDWYIADVLHFPFRSREQYLRKGLRQAHGEWHLGQYVKAFHAQEAGRVEAAFNALLVDDATLERGRASGALAIDTRLRERLKRTGENDARVNDPSEDELSAVFEAAALRDADTVRLSRLLDDIESRVAGIEGRGKSPRRRLRLVGR
jgi:Glycosyl transferase family 2